MMFQLTFAPPVLHPILHPRWVGEVDRLGHVHARVVTAVVRPGESDYHAAFPLHRPVDVDALLGDQLRVDVDRLVPHEHRASFVLVRKLFGKEVVKVVGVA